MKKNIQGLNTCKHNFVNKRKVLNKNDMFTSLSLDRLKLWSSLKVPLIEDTPLKKYEIKVTTFTQY